MEPIVRTRNAVSRAVEGLESMPRPTWRGLLHAFGFVVSVPAGVALIASASETTSKVSAAVFAVTLTAVFATSAYYHRRTREGDRRRELWRRLDHSMIFLLIAGTYTPVCLLGLPPAWGVPMLVAAWVVAALGVVAKLVAFHTLGQRASVLYGALGWAAAIAAPQMVTSLAAPVLALLVAGGVCYSAGAVVLARNAPNPSPRVFGYHEVWHAATVVAAGCHFAMVAMLAT